VIGHSEGKKDFGRVKKGWTKKKKKTRKHRKIQRWKKDKWNAI
jgi:hypothetical protein